MLNTLSLFIFLTVLSFQAIGSKPKPEPIAPEFFKELIESFREAGWDLNESKGLIPLKRFIRGGEPAALEGLADQRTLRGMTPGLATMMISSLEALNKFRETIGADRLRSAITVEYRHLREGIEKSRSAIESRQYKHIFNAIVEMNGVFTMVPHLEWSEKEKTYTPTIVKGHKKVAGSPLNNDVLELAIISRLLKSYKLPMPSLGKIKLLPQDSQGIEIPIRVQNYLPDVRATIKALTEIVETYKGGDLDKKLEHSQHRTGVAGVSKARDLIFENLTRQLDLSMVPNPPSPVEKERLAQLGYGDLRALARVQPADLESFNKLAFDSGIQPKRLLQFVARARIYSSPPFDKMNPREWRFFHELEITNFAEFMKHDPKVAVEKMYDSSTFNFNEKGELIAPTPPTSKETLVQRKKGQKEELIRLYSENMGVSLDSARKTIDRYMKEARSASPFLLIESYEFPKAKRKWLLDLENMGSRTYLIGLNEGMDPTGKEYRNFIETNENKPWDQFIKHFKNAIHSGGVPTIFHISQHEITLLMKYLRAEKTEVSKLEHMSAQRRAEMTTKGLHFRYTDQHSREWLVRVHDHTLMKKYGAQTLSQLFGSFHDLLPYLRRYLAGPSHTNSMKFVLNHLVKMGLSTIAWADAQASGLESISWFQDWLKTKNFRFLDRVLRYCMVDVLGMIPIILEIEKMSKEKPHPDFRIDLKYREAKLSEIKKTGEAPDKFWSHIGEQIRTRSRISGLTESLYNLEGVLNPSQLSAKKVLEMSLIFDLTEMNHKLKVIGAQRGTNIVDEDLQKEDLRVRTFDNIRDRFIRFLKNTGFPLTEKSGPYFFELISERYKLRPSRLVRMYILHMMNRQGVSARTSFEALTEALHQMKNQLEAKDIEKLEAVLKSVKASLSSLEKSFNRVELPPQKSTSREKSPLIQNLLTPTEKRKVRSCLRAG